MQQRLNLACREAQQNASSGSYIMTEVRL